MQRIDKSLALAVWKYADQMGMSVQQLSRDNNELEVAMQSPGIAAQVPSGMSVKKLGKMLTKSLDKGNTIWNQHTGSKVPLPELSGNQRQEAANSQIYAFNGRIPISENAVVQRVDGMDMPLLPLDTVAKPGQHRGALANVWPLKGADGKYYVSIRSPSHETMTFRVVANRHPRLSTDGWVDLRDAVFFTFSKPVLGKIELVGGVKPGRENDETDNEYTQAAPKKVSTKIHGTVAIDRWIS